MAWKNDSNAYELKPVYGSIEDQVKADAQKWFNKNHDKTVEQTTQYLSNLENGTYTFTYPYAILEVVEKNPEYKITSYGSNSITVVIERK